MPESILKSGWWNELISWDHDLFVTINQTWTNPYFDKLMPEITDLHKSRGFLMFFGMIIIFWLISEKARGLRCLLAAIAAVALTDVTAYRIIKPAVERSRPEFTEGVHAVVRTHSHSGNSFPSNHAANMFAAATVISCMQPWMTPLVFGWAALIAYSRVYVGVHYPIDVLGGALLGFIIAKLLWHFSGAWVENVRWGHKDNGEVPRWKKLANSQPSGKRRKRSRKRRHSPPTTAE